MWTIDKRIEDVSAPRGYITVCLNPNKGMIPGNWTAPIQWTGYVGGKEVSLTQTSPDGIGQSSYIWEKFPAELMMYASDVIDLIRKAMKVMD